MSIPKYLKKNPFPERVKGSCRGDGDKILKGPRPKGRKARLDELEAVKKEFFIYLDIVEDDKVKAKLKGIDWKKVQDSKDLRRDKSFMKNGFLDYGCYSFKWHYERLVELRDKYVKIYKSLEDDGIVHPFPDHLI